MFTFSNDLSIIDVPLISLDTVACPWKLDIRSIIAGVACIYLSGTNSYTWCYRFTIPYCYSSSLYPTLSLEYTLLYTISNKDYSIYHLLYIIYQLLYIYQYTLLSSVEYQWRNWESLPIYNHYHRGYYTSRLPRFNLLCHILNFGPWISGYFKALFNGDLLKFEVMGNALEAPAANLRARMKKDKRRPKSAVVKGECSTFQ